MLSLILILAAATIAAGASTLSGWSASPTFTAFAASLEFPAWLRYAIGVTSNALLPFAFACFAARGDRWRAAAVLPLLLLFYPITLGKLALFAPVWLLFLLLLSSFLEARTAVVLSLFLPISAGVILVALLKSEVLSYQQVIYYFGTVNFRMIAFPSIARSTSIMISSRRTTTRISARSCF